MIVTKHHALTWNDARDTDRLNALLDAGWTVHSVTRQCVSAVAVGLSGALLVILERNEGRS